MSIEQFTVQAPFSIELMLIAVFAVIAVVIGVLTFFKMRSDRDLFDLSSKIRTKRPALIALIFALIFFFLQQVTRRRFRTKMGLRASGPSPFWVWTPLET